MFYIQSTHSNKTCGVNNPEKNKIMRNSFFSTREKGIKIHSLVVNRPSHSVYMLTESETFEDINKMFEPILTMTDAKITPVMPIT